MIVDIFALFVTLLVMLLVLLHHYAQLEYQKEEKTME